MEQTLVSGNAPRSSAFLEENLDIKGAETVIFSEQSGTVPEVVIY